jgi:hypothetical protein
MDKHFNQIKNRNKETLIMPDNLKQDYTLETNRTQEKRVWRSVFNPSVRFYFFLFVLNTIGVILFLNNFIG